MNLGKIEIWIHDHVLKNDKIRHFVYGIYQRFLYIISPKIQSEGYIEKITPNDGYEYFFGYYDKCPWSDNGRFLLALKVKNACSDADSTAIAEIVRIDLTDKNKVETVATTNAWNVQQGCMAQWINDSTILYNTFRNGRYCSVVLNLENKTERIIEMPVYAMSPDKKTALSLDFSRLHRLRPGYGYANIPDSTKKEACPDSTCIWKIDIDDGKVTPLLKYTDFASFEPRPEMEGAEHKVNHLMISPDGKRFMVLHRWFKNKVKYTRLVTCNIDGTDMFNLSDDDFVSHCCWKNNNEILSYLNKNDGGKGYYLMKDHTQNYKRLWSALVMDGHPTYSYDGKYVVTDTYPDRKRIQSIYVMRGGTVKRVARVFSPFKYGGDTRCDLHPRWSNDSSKICFDGSFEGKRGVYIVNVENVTVPVEKDTFETIKDEPLVSVIIPCYNCAKLIDDTLECLESQIYRNFEVICINDGSNDDTLDVLTQWQKKCTLRMNIVDQDNGGVSTARNHGIEVAQGKYFLFLDSDDMIHKEFIKRLVEAKESNNCDTSYCKVSRKYDDVMSFDIESDNMTVKDQFGIMEDLLYRMGEFSFCCYLYEKAVIDQHCIRFDEKTKFGEDREFNWKYLVHCKSGAILEMPLYWYRINNDSATQKKASWRKTDLLLAVKRIEQYLDDNHCGYVAEFKSYMYARSMWAVAKTFAVSKDRQLFDRLKNEYDVKSCMRITSRDKNKLVKIASIMYCVHPLLFFRIIGLKN